MTEQDAIFTEQENAIFVIQALPHKIWEQMGLEEKKAIDMGIEALAKQMNSGWIPVSERLPSEEECNLYDIGHPCYRQFTCTIKIRDYEPCTRQLFFSKVFGWKYGPEDYNRFVTAWQPLLEPYKAGEDNE